MEEYAPIDSLVETPFLHLWADAARMSAGFFWMALWAFSFGYLVSSLIQVLLTRERMQRLMGKSGAGSVARATFFGFISSSCSFAALSTTRALLAKGAGLVPAIAFLLSSTNLVIELGIVIALFLGWQFVVAEYVGGVLLILGAWLFIRLSHPEQLLANVRERLGEGASGTSSAGDWRRKLRSREGWWRIGQQYVAEWQMVWRDVIIGFAVAGIISAFVPDRYFALLFMGSGGEQAQNPGFLAVLAQVVVGPIAAFLTFIGSMGNIPLAALLHQHGVSFAGVMAFIFSDLVVLPVVRVNARYYGWRMALYLVVMLLACLIVASLLLHYGFLAAGQLPPAASASSAARRDMFSFDYGFVLNIVFVLISAVLVWLATRSEGWANTDVRAVDADGLYSTDGASGQEHEHEQQHHEQHDHEHDQEHDHERRQRSHDMSDGVSLSTWVMRLATGAAGLWIVIGLALVASGVGTR